MSGWALFFVAALLAVNVCVLLEHGRVLGCWVGGVRTDGEWTTACRKVYERCIVLRSMAGPCCRAHLHMPITPALQHVRFPTRFSSVQCVLPLYASQPNS